MLKPEFRSPLLHTFAVDIFPKLKLVSVHFLNHYESIKEISKLKNPFDHATEELSPYLQGQVINVRSC